MMSTYPYDRIEAPIALVAENDDGVRGAIAALFTSLELRKFYGAELAGCLRMMRPEISVFYLGSAENCSEEVTRELIQGQAVLLKKTVSTSRLDDAIGMLEDNRAWAEETR